MKIDGNFVWKSSLMEIISAEERVSKTTEKPYMVVKARMVFLGNLKQHPSLSRTKIIYSMMCFKESLFQLFEVGNRHFFEGELSFNWGNTWLKITKLCDDSGNRLLRPQKSNCQDDIERERAAFAQLIYEDAIVMKNERERRLNAEWPCTEECIDCGDINCVVNLPY